MIEEVHTTSMKDFDKQPTNNATGKKDEQIARLLADLTFTKQSLADANESIDFWCNEYDKAVKGAHADLDIILGLLSIGSIDHAQAMIRNALEELSDD